MNHKYQIYCHSDTDGGIAAAIYSKFITEHTGWQCEIEPVTHSNKDWFLQPLACPCAILDFSMHPAMLTDKFYAVYLDNPDTPKSAWIDHHPTGIPMAAMDTNWLQQALPQLTVCWDTDSISTPGLFRNHQKALGLPATLIAEYSEFIDVAEIIDGALYADSFSAHDFNSIAIRLQSLFSTSHPSINPEAHFKNLVSKITACSDVEKLLDSDPLYSGIIEYERLSHLRQLRAYDKVTKRIDNVTVSIFNKAEEFHGLGRFIPYMMQSDVGYAIHVMPERAGVCSVTCGINPWNKPTTKDKHLGHYFAKYFNGGGHSFSAGGRIKNGSTIEIDALIAFLNS